MSEAVWKKLYRDTWKAFYSPEHMEKVLRRARATAISVDNMMVLLLWFHFCIVYEEIDPLQGGFFRRKYRRDRRPTLPVESVFSFYPRFVAGVLHKHWEMGKLALRFVRFKRALERDAATKNYNDVALTADNEMDTAELETMLTQIAVAR